MKWFNLVLILLVLLYCISLKPKQLVQNTIIYNEEEYVLYDLLDTESTIGYSLFEPKYILKKDAEEYLDNRRVVFVTLVEMLRKVEEIRSNLEKYSSEEVNNDQKT